MRRHFGERELGEKFEGGQFDVLLETCEHGEHVLKARHAEHHHGLRLRRGREFHLRFDDEAERALGANEQMPQVITRCVLDEPAIQLKHLAGPGHDGEARYPIARESIADHLDAARVGRNVAADLTRATRSKVNRVEEAVLDRELLQRLRHDTGLAPDDAIGRVEREDFVHPIERHDDFAVAGDGAPRQPRSAARRHEVKTFSAR